MAGVHESGSRDGLGCPGDETLAAYLEGGLAPEERSAIVAHLAECGRCLELVAALAPDLPDVPDMPEADAAVAARGPSPTSSMSSPAQAPQRTHVMRWLALAAALVVAPGAVLIVTQLRRTAEPGLASLQQAPPLERRPTFGRLSGFAYAPAPATYRSGETRPEASRALLDRAAAVESAHRGRDQADSLHVYGVAQLVSGAVGDAVETLTRAVNAAPRDARVLNDAATAYLQMARLTSDDAAFTQARRLAERAVAVAPDLPEAWFNLATIGASIGDVELHQTAVARLRALEGSTDWLREVTTTP
jgi:tetratricopeptide (TPR) repeat protein